MTPVRTSAIFSLSKNTINHAVTTVFINVRYTKTQLPVALVYNDHLSPIETIATTLSNVLCMVFVTEILGMKLPS